ncbi:hypothetical protein ACHAXM_002705 [Skeletonema potamos]
MKEKEPKPSRFQIWKLAARPHTLTASVAPVFVGYALTLRLIQRHRDEFMMCGEDENNTCPNTTIDLIPTTIQFAAFAGLIQISTNLHNDYADFVKGADTEKRVGQARATQKGWLTPYETCRGCVVCLLASLFIGMRYLIPTNKQHCLDSSANSNGDGGSSADPIMVFIVISSLFNAVAYTGGPFPLGYIGLGNISIGYYGLGDLFVFLYFGIVATLSVPYLYLTKVACISPLEDTSKILQLLLHPFLCSIPIGFLATNIIVVNNLRDRHTDIDAGKRTMAVRMGAAFARMEYLLFVVGSYAFCFYFWLIENESVRWTTLLPLLSLPMSIQQLNAVAFGKKDGQLLNEHVGGAAKLQLVYCILMTAGFLIANNSR